MTCKATLPPPARRYDRARDLARVLPLWPEEIADDSLPARTRLVARLARALRETRRRGRAGDWTYDLGRHAELLRCYRFEAADLAAARRTRGICQPRSHPISRAVSISSPGVSP